MYDLPFTCRTCDTPVQPGDLLIPVEIAPDDLERGTATGGYIHAHHMMPVPA